MDKKIVSGYYFVFMVILKLRTAYAQYSGPSLSSSTQIRTLFY